MYVKFWCSVILGNSKTKDLCEVHYDEFWCSVILGNSKTLREPAARRLLFWCSVILGNSKTRSGDQVERAQFWCSVILGNSKTGMSVTAISLCFGAASFWVTAKLAAETLGAAFVLVQRHSG